jgi:DNA repair exonuclease SbcCD ATPase subunit
MEPTDPHSHQSIEGQLPEQGSKLNISHVQSAQIEPQDAHWLRMDPPLTRAVLAKTEEELLGSLAALMRNKVEHEQVSRRFAQIQIDTEQARHELAMIKQQIRRAEEEVATRLDEQSRINEEIARARLELATLREDHQLHTEMVSGLKSEAAQAQQSLADAHRNLSSVSQATEAQLTTYREAIAQLVHVKNEEAALEEILVPLRTEVDERIKAREDLIAEVVILHNAITETASERRRLQLSMAKEQALIDDLLARKDALGQAVLGATDEHRDLRAKIATLESRLRDLTEANQKAEHARIAEGLPLLFGAESHKISLEWDSYPLESEFHTDEELDAKKVAELVSMLPGLEGCLIVKNHGPVLASEMPARIHAHLKVPDRNYQLLFESLEKKLEEYNLRNARVATFDLGEEALTVAQASHAFVFVNHRQPRLRPGMPGKLASIVSEVAKMYP